MVKVRQAQRLNRHIPLRIVLEGSSAFRERYFEAVNISARGVYFCSACPFIVGQRLAIYLTMPEEIVGTAARDRIYHGTVVRVASNMDRGAVGVAVDFLYYELMKNTRPEALTPELTVCSVVGQSRLLSYSCVDLEWERKTA